MVAEAAVGEVEEAVEAVQRSAAFPRPRHRKRSTRHRRQRQQRLSIQQEQPGQFQAQMEREGEACWSSLNYHPPNLASISESDSFRQAHIVNLHSDRARNGANSGEVTSGLAADRLKG